MRTGTSPVPTICVIFQSWGKIAAHFCTLTSVKAPHRRGFLPTDTANGGVFPEEGVIELAYDWPQLSRDEVFGLVQLKIRAGTTGVPNDLERQEVWTKLLPVIQPLIGQIINSSCKASIRRRLSAC